MKTIGLDAYGQTTKQTFAYVKNFDLKLLHADFGIFIWNKRCTDKGLWKLWPKPNPLTNIALNSVGHSSAIHGKYFRGHRGQWQTNSTRKFYEKSPKGHNYFQVHRTNSWEIQPCTLSFFTLHKIYLILLFHPYLFYVW